MGFLDSYYDPSSFSDSGGLLGRLMSMLGAHGQAPMNSGLPSDQANYGPAPMPGVNPAMGAAQPQAIPQNPPAVIPPQPMPQAAPAQAPQVTPAAAQPDITSLLQPQKQQGGLGAALQGAMANIQGGPLGMLGGAFAGGMGQGLGTPQAQQQRTTIQRFQLLKQAGIEPNQALLAAIDPDHYGAKILDQAFGAKAPTALGNGYIWNPQTKKVERAYEPEDKIPAGFVKSDDGNMHFIPGGPADPQYLRLAEAQKKDPNANIVLGRGGEIVKNNPDGTVTVLHKNEQEQPTPMDPASLEILARREIGGDFSGRKNLGRGAQGASDLKAITNKSSEILTNEMGMTPTEAAAHLVKKQQEYLAQGQGLNAEARTTGVREANLNLILKAADAAIPAALEASDKVARTGWVPVNKVVQGGEVMASDPDLKKFGMANLQLAEHWARAMNPTGVMRESDRDKALSFLSTADSKDTYRAAVGQLRTQIERERDAVKATRGMSDLPGSASAAPAAADPLGIR